MKISKIVFQSFMLLFLVTSCSDIKYVNDPLQIEQNGIEENIHFNYTIGEGPFVYFKDRIFKELLLTNFAININKDNEISFYEATAYTGAIDVSINEIRSIIGIEKFVGIEALNCSRNNIEAINVRNNINLKQLQCGVNPFDSIDLTQNIKLTHLDIRTTNISTLNLSKNANLIVIRGICNSKLKKVNVRNKNNSKIKVFFFSQQNPILECVQVDDIKYATSATNWFISPNAEFSLNCLDSNS
jgi:hypothetical protein